MPGAPFDLFALAKASPSERLPGESGAEWFKRVFGREPTFSEMQEIDSRLRAHEPGKYALPPADKPAPDGYAAAPADFIEAYTREKGDGRRPPLTPPEVARAVQKEREAPPVPEDEKETSQSETDIIREALDHLADVSCNSYVDVMVDNAKDALNNLARAQAALDALDKKEI